MSKQKASKKNKKPWPTQKAMEQIYEMNLWGSNETPFFSGEGSHKARLVDPYVKVVSSFLNAFENPITVCDLGCGDFNIGKQLVKHTAKYIAVDIVEDLIHFNKQKFQYKNLEFQCLDIAKDNLPSADCVIIRQVLQHLSNAEIQKIVNKLSVFKYIILTEHLPIGNFEPNKDIISGQGIRLKKQSGVNIIAPPFNLKVISEELLLSIPLENKKGILLTKLFVLY